MKPMTIEQENALSKYRIEHDEIDRKSLQDWQLRCLARQVLIDAAKNIGARSDADT